MINKSRGFNIIELMVAITISATLVATIVKSYASLYKLYAYNVKFLTVNHEMRLALQVMENDINDAGIFGSYSLHNLESNTFTTVKLAGGDLCFSPWCKVDTNTVGVRSFSAGNDEDSIAGGFSLVSDSDILKVQHGSDEQLAYAIAKDIDKNNPMVSMCKTGIYSGKLFLSKVLFSDVGIDKTAGSYVLASANEAYLINSSNFGDVGTGQFTLSFTEADGCPIGGDIGYIEAHSNIYSLEHSITPGKLLQYDSIDPDIHSMTLSNLITNYYFVASGNSGQKKGLYRVSSNGKNLLEPELVSDKIDKIELSYLLDYASSVNKAGSDLGARYTICKTKDMEGGRAECKGKWDKVVAATIDLSASDNSATMGGDTHDQSVRETIGWKS